MIFSRRASALLATLGATLTLFACHDITAPLRQALSPGKPAAYLNPAGTVIVSPDSMRGWVFNDDQHDMACSDATVCRLVSGPIAPPLGAGSAELATPTAADGNAILLKDYRGTRMDQFTELRYSTYRHSEDAGNNLAIALQVTADYDLTDQSTAWQGRLVFEPYQGIGRNVPQNTWQSWDARTGKWWGTKSTVRVNNVVVANPCVQATPCTWTQLLGSFPNAGVHTVYGAVVLKAGSSWAGFRGNVDKLTIGVDGVMTIFDFEATMSPPAAPHLIATIDHGVVGTALPADSSFSLGATIAYSFAAAPGHDAPFVVLDDTLAPVSGTIAMDRTHTLEVLTDSTYTLEGLSDDGKAIVEHLREVMTTGRAYSYAPLIMFYLDRLHAGADPAALIRDSDLAAALVVQSPADSSAVEAADSALHGIVFTVEGTDDNYSVSYDAQYGASQARVLTAPEFKASGAATSRNAMRASNGQLVSISPRRSVVPADELESPREATTILYVNGIRTDPPGGGGNLADPAKTLGFLVRQLKPLPRFKSNFTQFTFVYNRTSSVQMREYDALHPCDAQAQQDLLTNPRTATIRWVLCSAKRYLTAVSTVDLVESLSARAELGNRLRTSNSDVQTIARRIKQLRTDGEQHVIVVAHSEGTILTGQVLRELPALEGHPLQVAPGCLATLMLAPAVANSQIDLTEPYKTAVLVRGDVIRGTIPVGWEPALDTPASRRADSLVADVRGGNAAATAALRVKRRWEESVRLHSIDDTYLRDSMARRAIIAKATTLHKECLQGELTVSPDSLHLAVDDQFDVHVKLFNQNNRELFGRRLIENGGSALPRIAEHRFRAFTPSDPDVAPWPVTYITNVLREKTSVTVAMVSLSASISEELYGQWGLIEARNGPDGNVFYPPSRGWDGIESCPHIERQDAADGGYAIYELTGCNRVYTVNNFMVTDPTVGPQVVRYRVRYISSDPNYPDFSQGASLGGCGAPKCREVVVDAFDASSNRVATSGNIVP